MANTNSRGLVTSTKSKSTQLLPLDGKLFSKDYVGIPAKGAEAFVLSVLNGSRSLLTDFDYNENPDTPGGTNQGNIPPTISTPPSKPITVPGIGAEESEPITVVQAGQETFDTLTQQQIDNIRSHQKFSEKYLNEFSRILNEYKSISKYVDYVSRFTINYDGNGDATTTFNLTIDDSVYPLVSNNDTISIKVEKIL